MSSCFHKYNMFWLTRSTKAHRGTPPLLSGSPLLLALSLYQSGPNSRLFVSVLMYSVCLVSRTSPLLHHSRALNPFRGNWGIQLTDGEGWRNVLEAGGMVDRDPIGRYSDAHCLQTHSITVTQTVREASHMWIWLQVFSSSSQSLISCSLFQLCL